MLEDTKFCEKAHVSVVTHTAYIWFSPMVAACQGGEISQLRLDGTCSEKAHPQLARGRSQED